MDITQKLQLERIIDEIDSIGEGKLTIVWKDGTIKAYPQYCHKIDILENKSIGEVNSTFKMTKIWITEPEK